MIHTISIIRCGTVRRHTLEWNQKFKYILYYNNLEMEKHSENSLSTKKEKGSTRKR